MAFRKGGAKHRRDQIEPALIQALRAVGVECWQLHGTGLPDLLCWIQRRGGFHVLELKSAGGRLTKAQADVPWPIVRSVPEAFAALGLEVGWAPIAVAVGDKDRKRQGNPQSRPLRLREGR